MVGVVAAVVGDAIRSRRYHLCMAFGFFKSKKKESAPETAGGADAAEEASGGESVFEPDPRKASRFFEHAESVADARNYDYAIECYVNGLKHDPDNLAMHEALHEVAKRRKVSGGKAAGFMESMKSGGSTPLEKLLHAERLWAMDPMNARLMRDVMKYSVSADEAHPDLQMGEVGFWVGTLALNASVAGKPDKGVLLALIDLFSQLGRYDKAVEACRHAIQISPDDSDLHQRHKELEAENAMAKGNYGKDAKVVEGGYRQSLKGGDEQAARQRAQSSHAQGSDLDAAIEARRREFDEDPSDVDRRMKLVDALLKKATPEAEREAVELLNAAWDSTGQYRYKLRAGDIIMKQLARHVRDLRQMAEAGPGDEEVRAKLEAANKKRLTFELQEYSERAKNYPTDLTLRFELGKRLYAAHQYDDAIAAFQQAKQDGKNRDASMMYLGSCYIKQGWLDEAVSTLQQALDGHEVKDDKVGMELRYLLMDAQQQLATKNRSLEVAEAAQKNASTLLQTDIGYRDIREKLEAIKGLVAELAKEE